MGKFTVPVYALKVTLFYIIVSFKNDAFLAWEAAASQRSGQTRQQQHSAKVKNPLKAIADSRRISEKLKKFAGEGKAFLALRRKGCALFAASSDPRAAEGRVRQATAGALWASPAEQRLSLPLEKYEIIPGCRDASGVRCRAGECGYGCDENPGRRPPGGLP